LERRYTGQYFTDPRKLDMDHVVPLAEAHQSGGYARSIAKYRQYANDLASSEHLIAVASAANRSDGRQ